MNDLEEKIRKYKELKNYLDSTQKQFKVLKESIVDEMKQLGIREITVKSGSANVSYPNSFNEFKCIEDNPRETYKFISHKTVTEEITEFNKKGFEKEYPGLYEKYQIPLTPRLTIK